ncbi:hypothetical protein J2847_006027 [Azospirillum agricola]|nr:hypothetical protein [Azospirillum agricola]
MRTIAKTHPGHRWLTPGPCPGPRRIGRQDPEPEASTPSFRVARSSRSASGKEAGRKSVHRTPNLYEVNPPSFKSRTAQSSKFRCECLPAGDGRRLGSPGWACRRRDWRRHASPSPTPSGTCQRCRRPARSGWFGADRHATIPPPLRRPGGARRRRAGRCGSSRSAVPGRAGFSTPPAPASGRSGVPDAQRGFQRSPHPRYSPLHGTQGEIDHWASSRSHSFFCSPSS